MIINDVIYGKFEIEAVLQEIIETREIQRLKGVYQGGASILVNKNWNVTRYDHSIGTMLLIRFLGGSIKEQIAGLIHDISHTAFSHVVDYALDNESDNYHETIFENLVLNSSIPTILNKHGYNLETILNEKNHTILERKAPKLCADRIDYTLRDIYQDKKITQLEIKSFIKSLCVIDGEIIINSIESCEWFVGTYYKEVIDYFMNPLNIYAYDKLSTAIKICINEGLIDIDDFLKEDKELLEKMNKSNNILVKNLISELHYNVKVIESSNDYDIYKTTKLRLVDPTVTINGELINSSNVSLFIRNTNKLMREKIDNGIYVKILQK